MNKFSWFVMKPVLLGIIHLTLNLSLQAALPTEPGIYFNHSDSALTPVQAEHLIQSLRRITGLDDLQLTPDGALITHPAEDLKAGSLTARNILLQAIRSGLLFIVEDHSGSHDIHFGQLDEGVNYEDVRTARKFLIFRVRLDFKDFKEMQAPREVRESFDIGFTLLHELLHGLGYEDTKVAGEIGGCEELINRARIEIGLPIREQYMGKPVWTRSGLATIRLSFKSIPQTSKPTRSRRFYLYFLNRSYPGSDTTAANNAKPSSRTLTKSINSSIQR